MNARRKITLVAIATMAAFALMVTPALADTGAVATTVDLAVEEAPAGDDDDHRIALVDTSRDRFGLLMWALLFIGGAIALINARKQLKGERDQASGEFRWR